MEINFKYKVGQYVACKPIEGKYTLYMGTIYSRRAEFNEEEGLELLYQVQTTSGVITAKEDGIYTTIEGVADELRNLLEKTYNKAINSIDNLRKIGGVTENMSEYLEYKRKTI